MALVLYAEDGNKNACKSLIAAEYCGVKIDHVKEYQKGVSDESHLFLKNSVFAIKNPVGKVPVLMTPDGPIVESNAMPKYVAEVNDDYILCGCADFKFIDQWMSYTTRHFDEVLIRWVYMRTGVYPYTYQAEERLIQCLRKSLDLLNKHLNGGAEFLVCKYITLADIVVTCDLYPAFANGMPRVITAHFPHVERYFWNTVRLPIFKKFLGEIQGPVLLPNLTEIKPDLCVSRKVFNALCNKRRYRIADLEKENEVDNMMIDLEEEGANNQLFEPQKIELAEMTEKQRERVNKMVF